MSEFNLDGVLRIIDKTKSGTDSAKKNVEGFEKAVKTVNEALKTFAIIATVKAVAELTVLGAQANAVEKRFIALAGGAEQAEGYLRAIREETNYTVDSMTAMAAASKYMTLGLADSADSAARLIGMAVQLGDQTASTQQRIDDLGALLANQSIPRLDNFGISSAKVRERIKELQDALPGMTREAAFNQAVMEEGALAMEKLGDSSDNQAASLARAQAAWKNFKTGAATFVADIIMPAVDGFGELVTYSQRVTDALDDNTKAAVESGKSWEEYARTQYAAHQAAGRAYSVQSQLSEYIRITTGDLGAAQKAHLDYNYAVEKAIELGYGFGDTLNQTDYETAINGLRQVNVNANDVALAMQRGRDGAAAYEEAQRLAGEAAADASISFSTAAAALGEMSVAQVVSAQLKILQQAEEDGKISADELATATEALLRQTGLLTETEILAQRSIDESTQAFIDHKIGAEDLATSIDNTVDALDGLDVASGESSASMSTLASSEAAARQAGADHAAVLADAYTKAQQFKDKASEVAAALDELSTKTVTINIAYNVPPLPKIGPDTGAPGSAQAFANGGTIATNGPALVGERGPELIYGARGAHVVDASRTTQITNQWGGVNVYTSMGLERVLSEQRRARMNTVRI